MIRRPPRSTQGVSSAASDVYKRQVWKTKEAGLPTKEDPKLGDAKKRGILLEAMSATALLLAGGDVIVMRHPEAIRLVREIIAELSAEQ